MRCSFIKMSFDPGPCESSWLPRDAKTRSLALLPVKPTTTAGHGVVDPLPESREAKEMSASRIGSWRRSKQRAWFAF